ncbi:hypothetical protein [Labrys okinawensis]|nr:hypothetical protein [Labrys okinawensis]
MSRQLVLDRATGAIENKLQDIENVHDFPAKPAAGLTGKSCLG